MSCLYILEIKHLSVVSLAIIFSHSEGCLFTMFIVFFAVQKLLSLIRSKCWCWQVHCTQSCLTLCDLMDCCSPCLLFQARTLGVGCHFLLQGIFPTQRSNLCPLHGQAYSLPLCHFESPIKISSMV